MAPDPETGSETAAPTKRGVLFIVTGAHFTHAAADAARSVARWNPGLEIGIFTDQPQVDPIFTFHEQITPPGGRRKPEFITQTPYEQTLYLDSDVRVTGPLDDLFRVLERFDLAGAQVRYRLHPNRNKFWRIALPLSFPQINCGVMLFNRVPSVMKLFADWRQAMVDGGFRREQVPFREVLWLSDVRFTTLGPEYNTRSLSYGFWPTMEPQPLILHLKPLHSKWWLRRVLIQIEMLPVRFRLWLQRVFPPRATK